ncbi:hypothetical protein [Chamaesiphon sp. VAR_69_metabat_338]|uniref:hypothetical protein n=1 Tax=Chamaesiphon sp. VAR_69_metabat_338 TaxID=2964704 RepID=UPI00286E6F6B|nr:hypothetical protein [Chamaesiphon sp. VAR_69_metabat_338]
MKKQIVIALALLCSSVATFGMSKPATAQLSKSSIGPSVEFGGGQTVFGVDSKFGISDNLSLRPFVYFPNSGTKFGTALTYDITLSNNAKTLQITPFVGGSVDFNTGNSNGNGNSATSFGLVGGVDLDLTDSLRLKGAVSVPLSNGQDRTTNITVGAGLRF